MDTPETVNVYQEYIIISFMDLIGVVGGTLSLYIGLAFYDSFFQVLSNCNLLIINMVKVYNRIKGIRKKNVTVSNEIQMEPKGQKPIKKKENLVMSKKSKMLQNLKRNSQRWLYCNL